MHAMPLDALAPDQRAVVQLVLQRGRSYEQIAELLKISEDAVRARAHAGLSALAGDVELPADKVAQVADYLLGQQNGKPHEETVALLSAGGAAREWAATVREGLEPLGDVPELPAAPPTTGRLPHQGPDVVRPARGVRGQPQPEDLLPQRFVSRPRLLP